MKTLLIFIGFSLAFMIEGACVTYIINEIWKVVKNLTNKHTKKMDKIGNLLGIAGTFYWCYQAYLSLEGYRPDTDIVVLGIIPPIGAVLVAFLKRYLRD